MSGSIPDAAGDGAQAESARHLVAHFVSKTVPFKFRGADLVFDLTHGLFSSADVDAGTRLLLRVLSEALDADAAAGKPPPAKILDAGGGVGVLGICAASALRSVEGLETRCQDRDELARLFTLRNAVANDISPSVLSAHAEPLLAGPPGARWDLILSNVPAKAGVPVLEDFVARSAGLLRPGGRAMVVVVKTLAGFFRALVAEAGAELLMEREGPGHSVLAYSAGSAPPAEPVSAGAGLLSSHPFYFRAEAGFEAGNVGVRARTVHGAPGFDGAGGAVAAAARLALRLGTGKIAPGGANPDGALLAHEGGQGIFPCWLFRFLRGAGEDTPALVLSGRNVLALEASRLNALEVCGARASVVPAADLRLGRDALLEAAGGKRFAAAFAFPELLPQSSLPKGACQLDALWEAAVPLLAPRGVFLASLPSSDAERFDRKKPACFARLGGVRRDGFRALAYRAVER